MVPAFTLRMMLRELLERIAQQSAQGAEHASNFGGIPGAMLGGAAVANNPSYDGRFQAPYVGLGAGLGAFSGKAGSGLMGGAGAGMREALMHMLLRR